MAASWGNNSLTDPGLLKCPVGSCRFPTYWWQRSLRAQNERYMIQPRQSAVEFYLHADVCRSNHWGVELSREDMPQAEKSLMTSPC